MRNAIGILVFVTAAALVGCDSGTPGGPGATNPPNRPPVVGQADETFTLDVPNLTTNVKQGESKSITIGIKRGKNTDADVQLKFTDLPKGLTIEPASPMIKHGETEAQLTIKAANDAALGTFNVQVIGHPTVGADAQNTIKVDVEKK